MPRNLNVDSFTTLVGLVPILFAIASSFGVQYPAGLETRVVEVCLILIAFYVGKPVYFKG